MPSSRPLALLAASGFLLVAAVTGCGDDDSTGGTATGTAAGTAAAPSTAGDAQGGARIEVSEVWARESPMVADAGAVYLSISNSGDQTDRLLDASVDDSLAGAVELHETTAEAGTEGAPATDMEGGAGTDMEGGAGTDMEGGAGMGMVRMAPVEAIEVPAGETVALQPGGYHIMLLELGAPLAAGETFELTLTFEEAGDQTVTAEVRDA